MNRITRTPEFSIVIFSFLFNFVWEFLQVPAFAAMSGMPHWEGIKVCTLATVGDVGISLIAFWSAALTARSRKWFADTNIACWGVYLAAGIVMTIGLEYYFTTVNFRWTYSDLMPRIPPFGTGLSPLAQWIVVPVLIIWFARRFSLTNREEVSS